MSYNPKTRRPDDFPRQIEELDPRSPLRCYYDALQQAQDRVRKAAQALDAHQLHRQRLYSRGGWLRANGGTPAQQAEASQAIIEANIQLKELEAAYGNAKDQEDRARSVWAAQWTRYSRLLKELHAKTPAARPPDQVKADIQAML
jgi:hypothetical protein